MKSGWHSLGLNASHYSHPNEPCEIGLDIFERGLQTLFPAGMEVDFVASQGKLLSNTMPHQASADHGDVANLVNCHEILSDKAAAGRRKVAAFGYCLSKDIDRGGRNNVSHSRPPHRRLKSRLRPRKIRLTSHYCLFLLSTSSNNSLAIRKPLTPTGQPP